MARVRVTRVRHEMGGSISVFVPKCKLTMKSVVGSDKDKNKTKYKKKII